LFYEAGDSIWACEVEKVNDLGVSLAHATKVKFRFQQTDDIMAFWFLRFTLFIVFAALSKGELQGWRLINGYW
jgi:hypothetical protein